MPENITAVYKDGCLRPLHPLSIPENETVSIVILPRESIETDEIIRIMVEAGLMRPRSLKALEPPDPVSEEEREEIAKKLGQGRPLSEIIISERDQLWK